MGLCCVLLSRFMMLIGGIFEPRQTFFMATVTTVCPLFYLIGIRAYAFEVTFQETCPNFIFQAINPLSEWYLSSCMAPLVEVLIGCCLAERQKANSLNLPSENGDSSGSVDLR